MRFTVLTALCFCATVLAQSSTVDNYVATESPIAKAGLLANIGPSGSKASGAKVCTTTNVQRSEILVLMTANSPVSSLQVQVTQTPTICSLGLVILLLCSKLLLISKFRASLTLMRTRYLKSLLGSRAALTPPYAPQLTNTSLLRLPCSKFPTPVEPFLPVASPSPSSTSTALLSLELGEGEKLSVWIAILFLTQKPVDLSVVNKSTIFTVIVFCI